MPSHLSADRPAAQPPRRGTVDALISQTRRLLGDVDAVRRDTSAGETDAEGRWQRALYDLALHQLSDLDEHLSQLRDGPAAPAAPEATPGTRPVPVVPPRRQSLLSRVGSAEWNLLTDEASWSGELYQILGRDPAAPPLTLDELPSLVLDEDRPKLTAMVTDCLIDAKRIDGEFRIVLPDGAVRTVHMMGEPVLDDDGNTASMWAVLRDVSELRRSQLVVSETRDSLQRQRHIAQTEHRLAVELQEAVLPPWRGSLRLPLHGPEALDLAARYLPSATSALIGGDWYDALELPGGESLLTVGDLTGHGVTVTSGMAMLIGALRGMAMAGTEPGRMMACLNQLLDATAQPALGSAVCCHYRPATRTLVWAQAGHPAPLLFRDGTGHVLKAPDGVLLGATSGAVYGQAEVTLEQGDLLLLHTDGLIPRRWEATGSADAVGGQGTATVQRLLNLAPRLSEARTAQECVRTVVEEFGEGEREDDACLLVARVSS
ncbi:PP2C family protein-serine/threonine phosphatase [Streptomyces ipomoeae]|uniref:PP2C family protein-serine/threonine phosphatase n=1 Tax=Streptomyces ipomoeae TaxID=103232 RepID=UPI001147258E|nr:PP2C family protein-serine/threonine phosphatase [Streptomyces ipomoeae]MDX2937433.1 SpoIIE family protein phosphatase [Streptomyces ipomoeae]TQE15900.1 phosphatase [Streptomyces ipomoeae]